LAKIGTIFAALFGIPIFFILHDQEIGQYFGFKKALISIGDFFVIMAVLILLSGIYIHIFIKEKSVQKTKITKDLKTTCTYLKKFF